MSDICQFIPPKERPAELSFFHFVYETELKRLMGILKEKDVTLEEVASRCGFSDKFYFAKVFKKIVGKTPTAYLNELKRKQPIKNE